MRRRARFAALAALAPLAALLACAGSPDAPAPGKARVFGTLRLVPHDGAPHASGGSSSYGSIRMRDASLVDYSTPGFAVVFAAADVSPGGEARVVIRDTRVAPRLDPETLAIGAGGRIAIQNASASERILSYPSAGLVRRLAPGERIELSVPAPGEQGLYLLDVPEAHTTVFAAPGPFAVVSTTGEFELQGLEPGPVVLRAWHPRFPPVARRLDVAADQSVRVDLEMGVSVAAETTSDGK